MIELGFASHTKNVQKLDSLGIFWGRTTHKSSAEFNSAYESGVMGLQKGL